MLGLQSSNIQMIASSVLLYTKEEFVVKHFVFKVTCSDKLTVQS